MSTSFSMNVSDILAFAALFVAGLAYWQTRPKALLRSAQREKMRVLALVTIILWEQIRTVLICNAKSKEVDHYMLASMRENSKRLEEILNSAIGLNLWKDVLGQEKHSTSLFTAFVQSLLAVASDDSKGPEYWLKMHLIMGMLRLIEASEKYWRGIDDELADVLHSFLVSDLKETARSYIEAEPD